MGKMNSISEVRTQNGPRNGWKTLNLLNNANQCNLSFTINYYFQFRSHTVEVMTKHRLFHALPKSHCRTVLPFVLLLRLSPALSPRHAGHHSAHLPQTGRLVGPLAEEPPRALLLLRVQNVDEGAQHRVRRQRRLHDLRLRLEEPVWGGVTYIVVRGLKQRLILFPQRQDMLEFAAEAFC